ncbi:MAG: hypothetical protein EOO01_37585 [Chitinophagaceae bacterium]|nr:MAG: hypothetical protein EOO01_37585 [Chitinophagaceae bacterium]
MKYLLFVFVVLCSYSSHAQLPALWDHLIYSKDLSYIKSYQEQQHKEFDPGDLVIFYYRTLCGDFSEGLYTYRRRQPNDDQYMLKFQIKVITRKGKIIYCSIGEEDVRPRSPERDGSKEDVDHRDRYIERAQYKDSGSYADLEQSFRETYIADLNVEALFNERIYYGVFCGLGGIAPDERLTMDTIVSAGDHQTLTAWLQSTNTETQLYGVYGCMKLKRKGLALSPLERQLVAAISKKIGTAQNCAYCDFGSSDIRSIIKDIKKTKSAGHIGSNVYDDSLDN